MVLSVYVLVHQKIEGLMWFVFETKNIHEEYEFKGNNRHMLLLLFVTFCSFILTHVPMELVRDV